MYKIAVDLGYGYTKGINENEKTIIFPSIVGPGKNRELAGALGAINTGIDKIHVEIDGTEYFVGELAIEESSQVSIGTLDENKINHTHTKVLLATASALLVPQGYKGIHLTTGLPLNDFVTQRHEFEKMLRTYESKIKFISGPLIGRTQYIKFSSVTIFPQAAGAIYSEKLLKEISNSDGLTAVVDVGHKTTDFIVFRIKNGALDLRADLSRTLDMGMSNVLSSLQNEFSNQTGKRLSYSKVFMLFEKQKVKYAGQELDFSDFIQDAKRQVAKYIIDGIKNVWQDELPFVEKVYLAGGASQAMWHYLKELHPGTILVEDAQFANAKGFLKYAQLLPVTEAKTV